MSFINYYSYLERKVGVGRLHSWLRVSIFGHGETNASLKRAFNASMIHPR